MGLDGLNGRELSALVVDARPFKVETRAYAGNTRGGHLAVIDPDRGVWYRVALQSCSPLALPPPRGREHQDSGRDEYRDRDEDRDPRRRAERDEDRVPAERVAVSWLPTTVFFTSTRCSGLYAASFKDLRNLTSYVTDTVKVRG